MLTAAAAHARWDSHWVVVHRRVFGGVPLKDELAVVQVTRSAAFLQSAQVTLLHRFTLNWTRGL